MATYYTASELRQLAGGVTAGAARESLSRSAKLAAGQFDVFLSHSVRDAVVVVGVRNLLTAQGLRVYVDWMDDPELDRSRVSPTTAARLQERMKQSRTLIYATSRSAQRSRWMPWELGCFDGMKGGSRISIFPIEDYRNLAFDGEEYLGLYKVIEKLRRPRGIEAYAVRPWSSQAESLRSFAKGENRFADLGHP